MIEKVIRRRFIGLKVNALMINERDTVAVATEELKKGDTGVYAKNGSVESVVVQNNIPIYHKFCIKKMSKGEEVIKYGESLGIATCEINLGEHVHTHNLLSQREDVKEHKIK